jgi:methylenetetrahydrofolate dehydrogenase (NADP+)/methenyltetrahydrofolate cyclohydrolase/formyltetrahydrofolate synthetase/formate--tetrahydrofolate ligase
VVAGRPLDPAYTEENLPLLRAGMANLAAHLEIADRFGVPVVVAINRVPTDSEHEVELVRQSAIDSGAFAAVTTDHHARGGDGARALAEAVVEASEQPSQFDFLYPLDRPIKEKIETIAREIYRAGSVDYTPQAENQIADFERNGFGYLPICMAKTHLSISDDPALKGAPQGYELTVREVRASVGAGFIYPLLGEMSTMPGLGATPGFMKVDVNEDGDVVGLS